MLFIGVGGAGGKTIRAISHALKEQLEAAGYSEGIPDAWQFLHIDMTYYPDGADFSAPFLSAEKFYTVAPAGTMYKDLFEKLKNYGDDQVQKELLAGWAIAPSAVPINTSPSTARAAGRLGLLSDFSGVKSALQRIIAQMSSPKAQSDLNDVAKTLPNQNTENLPEVFIFSSMGGATGSGMFQGVAEILKRSTTLAWAGSPNILLFTPEVFKSVPSISSTFAANTLGVLSELISEASGPKPSNIEAAYYQSGLPSHEQGISRNRYYFLDSTSFMENGASDSPPYVDMNQVFMNTGTSLAKSVINGEVTETLMRLPVSNQIACPPTDRSGLSNVSAFVPLWSIPSITKPIIEEAQRNQTAIQRWMLFWEGRRSTSLIESIPLANEVRRSIVTGWFLAALFGLREITFSNDGPKVQIWNPTLTTPGLSNFSMPLPSVNPAEARNKWVLAAVLKSTTLTLCEFGLNGDSTKVDAHRFLLYIGREVTTSIAYRDRWSNGGAGELLPNGSISQSEMIRNWVEEGQLPSGRGLLPILSSRIKESPHHPVEMMKELVLEIQEEYRKKWEEYAGTPWHSMPESWELRDDIELALSDIYAYLDSIQENIDQDIPTSGE
jgi:hypothetical protein